MFMKTSSLSLKRKSLLGFSVAQILTLLVLVCGGTTYVLMSANRSAEREDEIIQKPMVINQDLTTRTDQEPSTAPKVDTPSSTQQSAGTTTMPIEDDQFPDQYGCITNTSGYSACVEAAKANELYFWCSDKNSSAIAAYNVSFNQAQAAYDSVMAEWNAVKDEPYYTHHPYSQYATDAKTKYNAIIEPAYETFKTTIDSLNSKGCKLSINSVTYWVWPL